MGKKADGKLVARIISDTFYYGYMYAPKWKEYAWGKHEPLVDQSVWEQANLNVFGNKRSYQIQDNTLYPLKGMLLCINCSHPPTPSNPMGKNRRYLYYECHYKKCTDHHRVPIKSAHKQFDQLLSTTKPSKRVLKLFTHLVFSEWEESIELSKREAAIIDRQIENLENDITTIAVSNAKHILTDEEAIKRADKVRKDIVVLRIERSDIRIGQYNTETVKNFTQNFLLHIDKLWVRLDLAQKQALQNEIFPQGLIVKENNSNTNISQ